MTDQRPGDEPDRDEPDRDEPHRDETVEPAGQPGGLRSASSIFGEARLPDNWPTRRQIREAERAGQSGEVTPLPRTGDVAPVPLTRPEPAGARRPEAPISRPEPPARAPEPPAAPAPAAESPAPAPEPPTPVSDAPTQAVPMQRELDQPSEYEPSGYEPDAAGGSTPVPPTAAAPHPRSIELPFLTSTRDARAAEARSLDEERRRVDPDGVGREDVDWLGRATGSVPVVPSAPPESASGAVGVHDTLPDSSEPPSFTDLLRVGGADAGRTHAPFDWMAADDDAATGSDQQPAVDAEPPRVVPARGAAAPAPAAPVAPATPFVPPPVVPAAASTPAASTPPVPAPSVPTDAEQLVDPLAGTGPTGASWSLSDEAARTGEVFPGDAPGDVTGDAASDAASDGASDAAPPTSVPPAMSAAPAADLPPELAGSEEDHPDEVPTADVPWWAQPSASDVPPTAAPPLVDPSVNGEHDYPAHLPPAVGQELDALLGIRPADQDPTPTPPALVLPPEQDWTSTPAAAPQTGPQDEIDQTEWEGRETSDTRAINALFGTGAMQKVDGPETDQNEMLGDTGTRMMPAIRQPDGSARATGPRHGPPDHPVVELFRRLQAEGPRGKRLLIIGAIAIIVVLLILVFVFTRWILGGDVQDTPVSPSSTPAAAASPQRSATPAPSPTAEFASSVAPAGPHSWRDLAGGECLQPYSDAWSRSFSVVDCASPHLAQMTYRGTIDATTYPGADSLQSQMNTLCSASTALDMSAAAHYSDVQVQGAYPADDAEWASGDHYYYCFVTRSSGQPLTGSLAPSA